MDVVILAGGMGNRLKSINEKSIPKPMMKIAKKPNLESQVMLCVNQGFRNIHFLSGFKANFITEYFGDGRRWGCKIFHHIEQEPLGTTGAILSIINKISSEFLLIFGDVFMDLELKDIINFHRMKKADVTLVVHPNRHPYDSDLVELSQSEKILALCSRPYKKEFFAQNLVNAGAIVIKKKLLKYLPNIAKPDFAADVLPYWLKKNIKMFGYKTIEYMRDIGTPERYNQVNKEVSRGKHLKLQKKSKKRAIFILNLGEKSRFENYFYDKKKLSLKSDVGNSLNKINNTDFLTILFSLPSYKCFNQTNVKELIEFHKKLEWNLGKVHSKFDGIYFPKKKNNFEKSLDESYFITFINKFSNQAANDYNIELTHSYFLCDSSIILNNKINISPKIIFFGNKIKISTNSKVEHLALTFRDACNYIFEKEEL